MTHAARVNLISRVHKWEAEFWNLRARSRGALVETLLGMWEVLRLIPGAGKVSIFTHFHQVFSHGNFKDKKFVWISRSCFPYLLFGTCSRTDKNTIPSENNTNNSIMNLFKTRYQTCQRCALEKQVYNRLDTKIQDWINGEIEHISMHGGVDEHGGANNVGINLVSSWCVWICLKHLLFIT